MKPEPFRLGILGLGEGVSILSAATSSALAEAYTICDLNEDLCRQRADAFGIQKFTTQYSEMLADPLVEGVAIYTPDPLHAEHVKLALQAGKHVICTKPLFKGLADAKPIYDLWRASELSVMVGMSCRFFETFQRQRSLAEAGRHGVIHSVEAHYNGDKRGGTSGSWGKHGEVDWLYTGVSHPVDLVYWHLGPIESVAGFGTFSASARRQQQCAPDMLHFTLQATSGAVGRVTGCFGSPNDHPDGTSIIGCTLRGDNGVSQADYPQFRLFTNFDGEGCVATNYEARHSYYFRWGGSGHHAGEFQNYLEYFVKSIRNGIPPQPDLADGIRVIATLDAMKRAITEQRVVSISEELTRHNLADLA